MLNLGEAHIVMKYIYLLVVILLTGCVAPESKKSELYSFCPDRDRNVLTIKEGQTFEDAMALYQEKRQAELDALREKTIAEIGVNIDFLVLGTMQWVDSSICVSVIGSEPSDTIEASFRSRGIDLGNCGKKNPYLHITSIDKLNSPDTYAVHFASGCGGSMCSSARVYKLQCKDQVCEKIEEKLCWIS